MIDLRTKEKKFKNIEIGLLIDQASTYIDSINRSFVETGTRLPFCSRLYMISYLFLHSFAFVMHSAFTRVRSASFFKNNKNKKRDLTNGI